MTGYAIYITKNVGTCLACMRQSFQLAVISWTATAGLSTAVGDLEGRLGLLISLCLSALWLAHLVVYASRNSTAHEHLAGSMHSTFASFVRNFVYAVSETAVVYHPGVRDRFGLPLFGRSFVVELKNRDGSRTAYRKTVDDVYALVQELSARGYVGEMINPEYWMSTDSCERSAAKDCADHKCDDTSKKCKGTGGMGACRCT